MQIAANTDRGTHNRAASPELLIRAPPCGSVVFARYRATPAEAACSTRSQRPRLAGRRGDSFTSLPQRRRQGTARQAGDQRIRHPAQGYRNVAGQSNGFEFHIDAAIALLVPGDALQPPDETVTLARREGALGFLPVRFDLLGAGDVGDVVPAPLVHREIARLVLTLQGGVHEQDIIEPKHGVLLLAVLTRQ